MRESVPDLLPALDVPATALSYRLAVLLYALSSRFLKDAVFLDEGAWLDVLFDVLDFCVCCLRGRWDSGLANVS